MSRKKDSISLLDLPDFITSQKDPKKEFDILELIGEGAYGSVYKALHKASGLIVAIKILPTSGDTKSIKHEISILRDCRSPYIVSYYGSYLKDSKLWLVMEYCAAGAINDMI